MSTVTLWPGDCRDVLSMLPDCCVDSVVTDPPYGLSFMGRAWDHQVPDVGIWREVLRVCKPGAHLLSFFGTRTYHRGVVAIEDAGFEIRDQIGWAYGSGFPKSLDVSKAIDKAAGAQRAVIGHAENFGVTKQEEGKAAFGDYAGEWDITTPATKAAKEWQGWGTALKPALEPIVVARKLLIGTVAANVEAWRTGALNIDGCRIAAQGRPLLKVAPLRPDVTYAGNSLCGSVDGSLQSSRAAGITDLGRWPANLIHDGSPEVLEAFPQAPGQGGSVSGGEPSSLIKNAYGARARVPTANPRTDKGSAARFFYCAKASKRDRDEGLDGFPTVRRTDGRETEHAVPNLRTNSRTNHHPTVKPTDLMRYLCRLVTPPGGIVLDPFMGSGSTGKAAVLEGFQFIGIEREAEYIAIATARIEHARKKAEAAAIDFDFNA